MRGLMRKGIWQEFDGYQDVVEEIKASRKLRQFYFRGMNMIDSMWKLELAAYNVEKLARMLQDRFDKHVVFYEEVSINRLKYWLRCIPILVF